MKLEDAVEHKRRIMQCVHRVNMALSLASSAGLKVDLQLLDVSTLDEQNATMLHATVLIDPSTLDGLND